MGDLDCVSCVSDGLCVCSSVSVVVCVSPSKICVDRYGPCKSLKLGDFVDREDMSVTHLRKTAERAAGET